VSSLFSIGHLAPFTKRTQHENGDDCGSTRTQHRSDENAEPKGQTAGSVALHIYECVPDESACETTDENRNECHDACPC
jgi:hypothetical protein